MGKPRVYERWRCKVCGTVRVLLYRSMAWVQNAGRQLPCETCVPGREPWTDHEYIGDAPKEVQ